MNDRNDNGVNGMSQVVQQKPSNNGIIRQVQEIIICLYGQKGYTLGDDGFLVHKREFKRIVKLPRHQYIMDEVQRRHDCCDRLGIKTALPRPPLHLGSSNLVQLKDQLRNILPSVIAKEDDERARLHKNKQQLDAIRSAVDRSPVGMGRNDACTALWCAMQGLGHIQVPTEQDLNPTDTGIPSLNTAHKDQSDQHVPPTVPTEPNVEINQDIVVDNDSTCNKSTITESIVVKTEETDTSSQLEEGTHGDNDEPPTKQTKPSQSANPSSSNTTTAVPDVVQSVGWNWGTDSDENSAMESAVVGSGMDEPSMVGCNNHNTMARVTRSTAARST